MSSFATAAAGVKAATVLLAGRRGFHNAVGADLNSRTGALRYTYSPAGTADALNVTGTGYFTFGYLAGDSANSSTTANCIITIDGVTVLSDLTSNNIIYEGMCQAGNMYVTASLGPTVTREAIPFKKSLVINIQVDTAAYYYYDYYLT